MQTLLGTSRARLLLALVVVYFVWGSTYLVMRFAMVGYPPLLMGGLRFFVAGALLLATQRLRGDPALTTGQWLRCAAPAVLMLAVGNGGVAIAEQTVGSGLASVMVASVPLWVALFSGLIGHWPTGREALGLLAGTVGLVLLNMGSDLRGHRLGALALMLASASWALGSVWSRRIAPPSWLMASAAQMLCGGSALLAAAAVHGERPLPHRGLGPEAALAYLVGLGSILAYSAYGYLVRHASPAVATSYAFANPVVAVLLGIAFDAERPGPGTFAAMAVILLGVALVMRAPRQPLGPKQTTSGSCASSRSS